MKLQLLPLVISVFSFTPLVQGATPLYWDTNGSTPGAGNPGGTWAWSTSDPFWNSASDGGASGAIGGWVNGSAAVFSAGSDATGSFTLTPSSSVASVDSITYNNGSSSAVLTINPGATINNVTGHIDVNGASGTRLAFNAILTGSNGLTKGGVGILQFNSNTPTYTGDTFITAGALRIASAGRIPMTTVVDVSSGAIFDLRANASISGLSGAGQVHEGASNTAATLTLGSDGVNQTFTGTLAKPTTTGTLHLVKGGSYTQTLGGTANNLYAGNTTVNGGVLALAKTAGVNAIAGGVITVNDGGTLRLDAANQIADGAVLNLAGGAFDLGGSQGESFTTALGLSGDSTINFGAGLNALTFGDSSGEDWGSFTITVTNFSNESDLLRFGTSASALSVDQLALFRFADYGFAQAQIDEFGYITAVPEPSSAALLASALLPLLGLFARRRKAGAAQEA